MQIRVNKNGKIAIPKELREKYNFTSGVPLRLYDDENGIIIKAAHICSSCGRALPDELVERGACLGCEPSERYTVYVY